MNHMCNIREDLDVIREVRKAMEEGNVSSSIDIILDVYDGSGEYDRFKFWQGNMDDMVVKLFDLSMTSNFTSIAPQYGGYYCVADNGMRNGIHQFEFRVVPSEDHSTNITPKLVEFLKMLVDPFELDRLKESLREWGKQEYRVQPYGMFITLLDRLNIWDYFERNEDER